MTGVMSRVLEPFARFYAKADFHFGVKERLISLYLLYKEKGNGKEVNQVLEDIAETLNEKVEESIEIKEGYILVAPDFRAYRQDFIDVLEAF